MSSAFLQLGRIILGYCLSSLITGYVVYVSMYLTGSTYNPEATLGNPAMGLAIAFMISWFASLPAALTVWIGEWRGWRMWWYYGIAGSLIGLALGMLFRPPAYFPWLGLSFGVVSGAIFWAIAGRKAGLAVQVQRHVILLVMAIITCLAFAMIVPSAMGLGRL